MTTRDDLNARPGTTLVEFGAAWCPICQAARPKIDAALAQAPALRYERIEDGPGQPLGRSFQVKLWPTLILMHDGQELARLVRPNTAQELDALLRQRPD